jgi:hypothetical protein
MTIATATPMAGVERSSMNSIVFASCFGTIIEWYDFLIYATAATLVFNKAFFPTFDPLASTRRSAVMRSDFSPVRSAARCSAISAIGLGVNPCW